MKYRIYGVRRLHSKPEALTTHGISSLITWPRCRTGRCRLRPGFLALDLYMLQYERGGGYKFAKIEDAELNIFYAVKWRHS